MGRIQTTLNVPFTGDENAFGNGRLLWETHPGLTLGNQDAARLYPGSGLNQPFRVRTNIGTVSAGPIETFTRTEPVQFSGGTTGSTKYPIVGGFSYRSFGALFTRDGLAIGGVNSVQFGVPTPGGEVPLVLKGTRNGVEANTAIYGHLEVTYQTSYRVYTYEPVTEVIFDAGGIAGVRVTKGFIVAFENGNVATYEVPLGELPDNDDREVYRIISEAVINEDGAWELPEDWTGQPGSPTHPQGDPDPNQPSLRHERVHESGFLSQAGTIYTRRHHVRLEEPFVGSFSYRPVFSIKLAEPGQDGITEEDLQGPGVQRAIQSAQDRFGI